jgi:acetoacetyl-CoA synthetase
MSGDQSSILWTPSQDRMRSAAITDFARHFLARCAPGSSSPASDRPAASSSVSDHETAAEVDYRSLHQASIENPGPFWRSVWEFCRVPGEPGKSERVSGADLRSSRWFPDGKLNFARALLHPEGLTDERFASATCIVAWNEAGFQRTISWRELGDRVRDLAAYLYSHGLRNGDRVAAVIPNVPEAVIAMLAATAIGAVWSSCSPDFGDEAIFQRFGQIEPKFLFTVGTAQYNQKPIYPAGRLVNLLPRLPSVEELIVSGRAAAGFENESGGCRLVDWEDAVAAGRSAEGDAMSPAFEAAFLQPLPFEQPLVIVYSSGTTGAPKCIVHGAGGTLLQHVKEHQLHADIHPGDRLFYYTTTGWMMWNWLVSGLASRATIVLYDGSPLVQGPKTLWEMAASEKVTHFGASARYFSTVEKEGYRPGQEHELSAIRCVLSTGSPLMEHTFEWIYQTVGSDLNLASISGGTDILSCFVLGNPTLPVRSGEIQCKGLGMDVKVYDPEGRPTVGQPGELVCASPFPSMPLQFWNDPDGQLYHQAYFDRFPNCWCHGDWAEETRHGGFIIHGRSDATLNPSGIRIGTAEIYQQLESLDPIAESLATVFRSGADEKIVLFVRMRPNCELTSDLVQQIRQRLRERCSPRHVPACIVEAPDFPRTLSGKLSEIAVRNAISAVQVGNVGALENPDSLQFFRTWQPPALE